MRNKKLQVILTTIAIVFFIGGAVLLVRGGYLKKSYVSGTVPLNDVKGSNFVIPEEFQHVQNKNFEQLKEMFKALAQQKTARFAFQVLKKVVVGPNIDMHLLGHVVGDELYKQEGVNGMTVCDNDFRNACSHAIVVGLFADEGEAALPKIADACRKAPGGKGAYTMCFHGLGHGILSSVGYDSEVAARLCQKVGTVERSNSETVECIGGLVMEIVGGGFHDRQSWEKERAKTLVKTRPLGLCQQEYIPNAAKFMCYEYITPYLFEAVGANMGQPTGDDFAKAFRFCDVISKSEPANRDSCYGGFGKEFDGLVQSRDIRQASANSIPDQALKQVYQWCLLAKVKDGQAACVVHAVNSLYWGGENERKTPERFCAQNEDSYLRGTCYTNLTTAVSYYISDQSYRKAYCAEVPEEFRDDCNKRLNVF
jgi:hypothetical protein